MDSGEECNFDKYRLGDTSLLRVKVRQKKEEVLINKYQLAESIAGLQMRMRRWNKEYQVIKFEYCFKNNEDIFWTLLTKSDDTYCCQYMTENNTFISLMWLSIEDCPFEVADNLIFCCRRYFFKI